MESHAPTGASSSPLQTRGAGGTELPGAGDRVSRRDVVSIKKALLAATMLALPLAAQAQPINGLYVGAGAGVNYLQEADIELSRSFGGTAASRSGSAEFN